jgi:hypothetical protein
MARMMINDGMAPCVHFTLNEDRISGECVLGRVFPADCLINSRGSVGCACYDGSVLQQSLEAVQIMRRWRAMKQFYRDGFSGAVAVR